jgi:hypothetical protein
MRILFSMFSLVYPESPRLDRCNAGINAPLHSPETTRPSNSAPAFMGEFLILSTLMLTRFVLTLALSLV